MRLGRLLPALSSDVRDRIVGLNTLSFEWRVAGRYEEAIRLAEEACELARLLCKPNGFLVPTRDAPLKRECVETNDAITDVATQCWKQAPEAHCVCSHASR